MYKTMHEKANAKTPRTTPQPPAPAEPITRSSAPQPLTTRASTSQPANAAPSTQSTHAPNAKPAPEQKPKLDKTLFDLLTDVTAELIVESAKLDRLGRYLTKNPKN